MHFTRFSLFKLYVALRRWLNLAHWGSWDTVIVVGHKTPSMQVKIQSSKLSRLQLSSTNRLTALTSRDGILWVQGIPNVKNRKRESIENAYHRLNKGCRHDKFVIRYVTDVLQTQSRLIGLISTNLQTYFGPKVQHAVTDLITNKSQMGNSK